MANVFYAGKMISQQIDSYLTNGVAGAAIEDGALVTLGNLAADTTYDANGVEYDVYEATAAAAGAADVAVVDYAGISEGEINGNNYRMGVKLYGLTAPAGTLFRVRRLALHDKFWLGEDNFTGTADAYAIVGANGKHAFAAAAGESGYAVKILAVEDLTTGMKSNGKLYLCEVVQL